MSALSWVLVCTPDDPTAAAWISAAASAGVAAPSVVPWADVLNGTAAFTEGELVHAERLTPAVPTRYGGSRARYERFAAALETLNRQLATAGARPVSEAAATLLALDRHRCREHLGAAGVPVPAAGSHTVRQRFAEPGDAISTVSGSVNTTLKLVRTRSGLELRHTLHRHFYRGVNSYGDGIRAGIVSDILTRDDETVAVADLPTAYLDNAQHRFRFSVIDGRVTDAAGTLVDVHHAREYFGGRRREIDAYHQRFGAGAWQHLIETAEQAATAFPSLRAVGVDIAASQTGGPDVVYDIDPFGAQLPAALGLPGTLGEGLDVPATMLRDWIARYQSPRGPR